jgi:hypothetical protein
MNKCHAILHGAINDNWFHLSSHIRIKIKLPASNTWSYSVWQNGCVDMSFWQSVVTSFLVKEEIPTSDTHSRLQLANGDACTDASSVRWCVRHFKDGNTDIANQPRSRQLEIQMSLKKKWTNTPTPSALSWLRCIHGTRAAEGSQQTSTLSSWNCKKLPHRGIQTCILE